MTSATKSSSPVVGKDVQEQILATIRKSQEAVIDAITAWAETIKSITPELPALPEFVDKLPKTEELVSNAYDFAEKLLAGQRQFAEKVVAATAGALPKK